MSDVLVEQKGKVLWLTINRPEKRNAINSVVLNALREHIDQAALDSQVRAIVLTGAGDRAFCAGADISEAQSGDATVFDTASDRHPFIELYRSVEACNKPIIARLNGHAMGGGLGLMCMCDLVVASDAAKIGAPEAKIGVFPMMILSYMFRLIPRRKLMEMSLTGEPLTAAQSMEFYLVNEVVPADQLDAAVDALLEKILGNSPMAIQLGKKAMHAMQDMSLQECFEYSQLMIARISETSDAKEGMTAFIEKRKPDWG